MTRRLCSVDTAEAAATRIESWAYWFAREMVEVVNALWRGQQL